MRYPDKRKAAVREHHVTLDGRCFTCRSHRAYKFVMVITEPHGRRPASWHTTEVAATRAIQFNRWAKKHNAVILPTED